MLAWNAVPVPGIAQSARYRSGKELAAQQVFLIINLVGVAVAALRNVYRFQEMKIDHLVVSPRVNRIRLTIKRKTVSNCV